MHTAATLLPARGSKPPSRARGSRSRVARAVGSTPAPRRDEVAFAARPTFPMSRVVNHEAVKAALVLAAVDPSVGGVAIHGRRGTCKTVLVRATHALLPAHDVVPSSVTNANPDTPWEWETGLLDRVAEDAHARLVAAGVDVPRRPSPGALVAAAAALDPKWNRRTLHPNFVTVPIAATEDAVAGSVDVEASVRRGVPVFAPGLLARAHRGVLYLDELNLMDDAVANLIFAVVAAGANKVEREGVSASHACAPLVFATFNPDEGDVREPLLDRFAMVVSADAPLDREQRVEGVAIAARWQDDWRAVAKECEDEEDDAALEVVAARAVLPTVRISNDAIAHLVECAMALGCVGHRAELFAAKIARAAAAARGGTDVSAEDLRVAEALAIAPRATIDTVSIASSSTTTRTPQSPSSPPPPQRDDASSSEEEGASSSEPDENGKEPEDDASDEPESEPPSDALVFAPDDASGALDPSLALAFERAARRKVGRAGRARKDVVFSLDRGRYVKAIFPAGGVVRKIAVDATLRAAAPKQIARRRRAGAPPESRRVHITKDDLRNKRMSRRAGSLTVFLVDASGSMALHRMAAAKSAALRLVAESHTKRDSVALVSIAGDAATVLLPPTRSILAANRRLAELPCGGGTPLAHGLVVAGRVAVNAAKTKGGASDARVVLITDGGANVGLDRSLQTSSERCPPEAYVPSKAALREEAVDAARRVGRSGVRLLVVDTESPFAGGERTDAARSNLAKDVARAAGGKYHRMPMVADPRASGEALSSLASG